MPILAECEPTFRLFGLVVTKSVNCLVATVDYRLPREARCAVLGASFLVDHDRVVVATRPSHPTTVTSQVCARGV